MTLNDTAPTPTIDAPPGERRTGQAGQAGHEAPATSAGAPRWRRLTGGPDAPRWELPAVGALLVATAVLYLVDLGASGWANSFYSAAVQAGSVSWKAFLFGSSDSGNSITVDKPPASLWVMALSVRIFGLSSWAILVPQALMGMASVGTLYAAVRRHFPAGAALLAGATLALTPVATLMFRFNNPDALLVLLMTVGAYTLVRAVEDGRTRWLVLAGVAVGAGFLTKQLQVFLVVPALAGTYLVAGPRRLLVRLGQLAASGLAIVVSAGWWVALVELWPASSRPYIGGSTDNSFWDLTFGYNGFGRLTGNETGSVGGGPAGTGGRWGATGLSRLFTAEFGGQIAWLIPAALLLGALALVLLLRRPRTDPARAQVMVWGGWLLVTGLTFSLMSGIFHAYYTVALAPAVGGLLAVGAAVAWRHRSSTVVVSVLAALTLVTAIWAFVLLDRSSSFVPALRWLVLAAGIVGALGFLAAAVRPVVASAAAAFALAAALAGPAAYAVDTTTTPHTGSLVTAGPTVAGAMGGFPGGFRTGTGRRGFPGGQGTGQGGFGGMPGGRGGQQGQGGFGGMPGGRGGQQGQGGFGAGPMGGMGGLLNGSTPSSAVTSLLDADASSYTWVAATVGANNASGYQLATGHAVMPIGGFNGTDPSPTLAQFKADVAAGKIHYFIASGRGFGGGFGGNSSQGASSSITSWVEETFTAKTVGNVTVYDLTQQGDTGTSV